MCKSVPFNPPKPFAFHENTGFSRNHRHTDIMTVEICKPIRDDLADCVLRSNCVLRQERTVQDCIKNPQDLPEQCRHLMTSFAECKRGLVSFVLVVRCLFMPVWLRWRHVSTSILIIGSVIALCLAGYAQAIQRNRKYCQAGISGSCVRRFAIATCTVQARGLSTRAKGTNAAK